ncbi:MAG: alpha/beta hydrolase [Aeromicrobium sp.]
MTRLLATAVPPSACGVVVVLHGGGAQHERRATSAAQVSVLRMRLFARAIARAGAGRLAVYRVLNTYRGWQKSHTPIEDAYWALREVGAKHPGLPIFLVGHSLGGRAAILAANHPSVVGVVALNPWLYLSDHVDLPGRRVLVVHGDQDRVADPQRAYFVARALSHTTRVTFHVVRGGNHSMLTSRHVFTQLTNQFVLKTLADPPDRLEVPGLSHFSGPLRGAVDRGHWG